MNRLYFHVYSCNEHVNVILQEMIARMESSGLSENCDSLNFCILGDEKYLNVQFPKRSKIQWNQNPYEFDTLHLLWKECQEEDLNVCYVHTKGITKWGSPFVEDWRRYMSYFVLDSWEDRVQDLRKYDCTGVNLQGDSTISWNGGTCCPLHYSGNFWWSKSSHIRKMGDINKWPPDGDYQKWRTLCEFWLCQPKDSKYHCAWKSNVNHYWSRYTEENYIERKMT